MLEIDVVTLFPEVFPGPLTHSIPGRALERGLARSDGPRPPDLGPRPSSQRRRLPLWRRPGHDPPPRARGRRSRCPAAPRVDRHPHGSRRRALPPGARPGPGDALTPGHRLPALRGRRRARPLASSTSSSRSATTSSPAARCRRWSSSTPSCACCRAPSTMPRPRMNPSATACSSTRSTRDQPTFRGEAVPEILLSGDHGAVDRWRREQALERTRRRRPDLLDPRVGVGALAPGVWPGRGVRPRRRAILPRRMGARRLPA